MSTTIAPPVDPTSLYRRVLDRAGYTSDEPTEENVRACYIDYADGLATADVDIDEESNIPLGTMIKRLLRYCR